MPCFLETSSPSTLWCTRYYVGISGPGDWYLEWLNYAIDELNIPQRKGMFNRSISDSQEFAGPSVRYSDSSVPVELASSLRVATTASVEETASTPTEMSIFTPPSPHSVCLAFNLTLQAGRKQSWKSRTGLS